MSHCSDINLFIIFLFFVAKRFYLLLSVFSSSVISQCFSIMLCIGSFLSFSMVSTFSDDDNSSGISSCNGLFSTIAFVDFLHVVQTDGPLTFLSFPIISFSVTPFFQLNHGVELFSLQVQHLLPSNNTGSMFYF